ncbi:hypothetical protein Tco_1498105 [Tanacetum coccineum]
MANLPPLNLVADLPEDDPEEQPELAPEPDHLNEFAPHQIPQPEGNMNGWILEDDEEEEEEEDPEMEEENDNDIAEVINPYEEADPLNLPPPDSDTESEDTAVAPTPDDHEQEAEANTIGTTLGYHTLCAYSRVPSMWVVDLLGRLSVMDKYLAEFDTDLRSEIKGEHALRRNVCTLEDQWHLHPFRHYRERPYVAPTTPVAHVDRANPDDPSPRPTRHPRHDDPYVMVRDAAIRNEGDDAATTSDP